MPRILLAEDDPSIRQSLREYLADWCGHEVLAVEDGEAACLIVRDETPLDAVILDVRLPVRSGLEVLTAIREREENLPVILFTGSGTAVLRDHSLESDPFVRVLFKPIDDLARIRQTLDALLARSPS